MLILKQGITIFMTGIGMGDAVKPDKGDKSGFVICCLFPCFCCARFWEQNREILHTMYNNVESSKKRDKF